LAERPGARSTDLQRALGAPQSTVQGRLLSLRNRGLVRLVGGGREARYYSV
jgi:DNA-binding IclR family transcriptional regulator